VMKQKGKVNVKEHVKKHVKKNNVQGEGEP
jgi:hypothetical protein